MDVRSSLDLAVGEGRGGRGRISRIGGGGRRRHKRDETACAPPRRRARSGDVLYNSLRGDALEFVAEGGRSSSREGREAREERRGGKRRWLGCRRGPIFLGMRQGGRPTQTAERDGATAGGTTVCFESAFADEDQDGETTGDSLSTIYLTSLLLKEIICLKRKIGH